MCLLVFHADFRGWGADLFLVWCGSICAAWVVGRPRKNAPRSRGRVCVFLFDGVEVEDEEPGGDEEEAANFVRLLGGFGHLGGDGGGAEGGGEVEGAGIVLHAEEGGAEAEADGGGEEPGGEGELEGGSSEGGGEEVEEDPEPGVVVAVLVGVVDLEVGEEEPEGGEDEFGNSHGGRILAENLREA